MERRIEEDVEGWPTRPFEDGYQGLRQLGSADFSGVVRAGGTWVFFVNGKIVGVFDGEIEDVDEAAGTAHKAPHPSLPLLYAMQVTGGDTRAKYYTNDTPISEVHDTLSSGSFTGYVELSENVLSGDYYQLYHGGRSMSVAFVGNSGRMITGEDAFERADDEVGIYEVVDVDIEVSDVPEPDGADAGAAPSAETAPDDIGDTDDDTGDADDGADADSSDSDAEPTADDSEPGSGTGSASKESAADGDDATATSTSQQGDSASATATGSDADATDESAEPTAAEPAPPADSSASEAGAPNDDSEESEPTSERSASDAASTGSGAGSEDTAAGTRAAGSTASAERASDDSEREETRSSGTGGRAERSDTGAGSSSATNGAGTARAEPATGRSARADAGGDDTRAEDRNPADATDPQRSEAAWREATTVPSLDPDRSEDGAPAVQAQARSSVSRSSSTTQQSTGQPNGQSRTQSRTQQSGQRRRSEPSESASSGGRSASRSGDVDDTLEEEVLEREDHIDRLQQRVENLEDERDEVTEERDRLEERVESLTEENESLRGEIRTLEAEIEELEAAAEQAQPANAGGAAAGGAGAGGGPMTPRAAMEGTDLFVRYDSKSAPTLEAAHDGSADAAEVNENLRLDVHTQFEDEGVTVDGEPFEAFLEETMAYRFVEWLVRTLPYEIRETGSVDGLRDLYDALPEVDRVEFHGEVARDAVEDEEGAPSETFDVVVRDKMGEALFVANMNDARDPATGRMIVDLQEAAGRVKEHSMALASAFFVTRSFFEPAALETASEATGGSLLSRDSRQSYVKLSRKQGYHLCLVEARGEDLHLNVPEL